MSVSYLLIFGLVILFISSFFGTTTHLMKSFFSLLFASAIVGVYAYCEMTFEPLVTLESMTGFFYYHLQDLYMMLKLSQDEMTLVAQTIYLLCIFLFFFLVAQLTLSFVHLGSSPLINKVWSGKRLVYALLYFASSGFVFIYFLSNFSSLFNFKLGFLEGLITNLEFYFV